MDDDDDLGPPLEVATQPLPTRSNRPPPAASVAPMRVGKSVRPPPARESDARGEALALDPFEVEQAAGYGPLPRAVWESPLYAFRVINRRRELKTAVAATRRSLEEAEASLDEAMATLVERAGEALKADVACSRVISEQGEAIGRLIERRKKLDEARASLDGELGEVDGELAKLEKAHARQLQLIERGKVEAANAYAASKQGSASPAELDAARQKLSTAEQQAHEAHAAITDLRRRRKSAEQAGEAERAGLEGALAHARQQARGPLREIASVLLAARERVAYEGWPDLEAASKSAERARVRLATLERALSSFDAAQVRNGVLVVGGGVALIALMIAFGVIRMNPAEDLGPERPSTVKAP